MSGVSVGVSPASPAAKVSPPPTASSGGGVMGSLRVIELQLVAFIMIFSASGLVPLLDLAFPALASAYFVVLSRLVFPASAAPPGKSPEIFQGGRLFRAYVVAGTTVGLFLPLAYALGGFARGDDHAVRSATPHLFLLSFQILTENIVSGLSLFSAPVRALVPIMYTVRRIFVVLDWINDVWVNKTLPANADFDEVGWFWFGRGLAVLNMAYFSVNLFCFLIPRFLPRAFERYFKERDAETLAKSAHDKFKTASPKSDTKAD
ncbi:hypothetical protein SASPL_115957 [Salvia splendens]|uniref:DUF7733 domain-containing protein n=1 Tax=Salvia splendens TaxID=180675 RepID=A0A8X9A2M4_SALSN|nr:uncharacterized protein LOC121803338 [Salvia splendens]KAG6425516.1 hypothetical protein SASPL_115957 [Salvia splendens]